MQHSHTYLNLRFMGLLALCFLLMLSPLVPAYTAFIEAHVIHPLLRVWVLTASGGLSMFLFYWLSPKCAEKVV